MSYRPKDVVDRLGISSATLRLWSTKFEDYLSPGAQRSITENGGPAQRRYDEMDLQYFNRVKELLADGLTYEDVFVKLGDGVAVVALDTISNSPMIPPISGSVVALDQYEKTIAALEQTVRSQQETINYQGQLVESLRTQRTASQAISVSLPRMTLLQRLDWLIRGRMIATTAIVPEDGHAR